MFEEMRAVTKTQPWLSAKGVVRLATVNGARALGLAGKRGNFCGRFRRSHRAPVHRAARRGL